MRNPEYFVSVALAVVAAFIIAIWVPGDGALKVKLAISYGGLILLFLFGFMVLAAIASGKIDISGILMEKDSTVPGSSLASMSRFQLLVFTFVIAMSFFLIVVSTGKFPEKIPTEVLTLLGISATTYAVSKGIQAGARTNAGNGGAADRGGAPREPDHE
jgi:hypothetical protein